VAWSVQEYLKSVPPSLAYFSREESDTIVYTGYGLHKFIQLYSITEGKVCSPQILQRLKNLPETINNHTTIDFITATGFYSFVSFSQYYIRKVKIIH